MWIIRAFLTLRSSAFGALPRLAAAFLGLWLAAGAAWAAGPDQPVAAFSETLLAAMKKGPELGFEGRFGLIRPVFESTFAWRFMGKVAAGSHWDGFSEAQRNAYLEAYRDWSVASYAERFNAYKGQRMEVLTPRAQAGDTAEVVQRIHKSNGEAVDIVYKMRSREGQWLAVDVQVKGVSQLALARSQFGSVLADKGLDGLLESLRSRRLSMSGDIGS